MDLTEKLSKFGFNLEILKVDTQLCTIYMYLTPLVIGLKNLRTSEKKRKHAHKGKKQTNLDNFVFVLMKTYIV